MPQDNRSPFRLPSLRRGLLVATSLAALGSAALIVPGLDAPLGITAQAQNLSAKADAVARPSGFADVVATVKPAVISVRVRHQAKAQLSSDERSDDSRGESFQEFFRQFGLPEGMVPDMPKSFKGLPNGRSFTTGQGSGFFISADGYAVTNHHVVDDAETVEVGTDDGKTYKAKVVGRDQKTDLALIKVDGRDDFPFVKLADQPPRIGEWVLAVGNPFGLSSTVTAGIVSARGRDIGSGPYDFIQIDAPVNRGNSGGPTFNVNGEVIGVNASIFSPSGGNVGIAFAIPSDTVKSVVAQLREHGVVTRGWLGVQVQSITPDLADGLGLKTAEGALIAEPQPDSPAAKAGLAAGDVIKSVQGKPVKDARDLARIIAAHDPGSQLTLSVLRKGNESDMKVTLARAPGQQQQAQADDAGERAAQARLGLSVAPAVSVAGAGEKGVVVTSVDPNSPAAEKGLQTGDVIVEAAGRRIAAPEDLQKAVADARSGGKRNVLLRIERDNSARFVAVPLATG